MVDEEHLRHCMLYEFQRGRKATDAVKNICRALGEGAVDVRKCQRWFRKFRGGNFSLSDEPGRGRVSRFDQEALKYLLEQNPNATQQELSMALRCSQKTISNQLKLLGIVRKLEKWIPHELNQTCPEQCVSICHSLFSNQKEEHILEEIVTEDKK